MSRSYEEFEAGRKLLQEECERQAKRFEALDRAEKRSRWVRVILLSIILGICIYIL